MTSFPLIAAVLLPAGVLQPAPPPINIRVAIVAYEDFHAELAQFERLFAELSRRDPALQFQLAVGSYSEVLHWIDRQLVEVAVLTPGVFARVLPSADVGQGAGKYRYLGTIQLPAARSKWASANRKADGGHDSYRSVCLVSESSTLQSVADLREATESNGVEFLFVHPMSVSGRIAPAEALRRVRIEPTKEQIRFTYSHSQSIRMLADGPRGRERVAFVWDDAAGNDPQLEADVRRLPFPELDQLVIPHDVIIGRADFLHLGRLQELLQNGFQGGRHRVSRIDDWEGRFLTVRRWLVASGAVLAAQAGERTSLDDISQLLLQYSRSQPRPPRLALVLSGGGAKCSYQVGAVAALEEQLAELRRDNSERGLDIALVVGTSGGAINALPVAMGISSTEAGRQAFRNTWYALDQREIVRPSLLIRANMGLWFALLQTALLMWIVRRFAPSPDRRGWKLAAAFIALAAVEIIAGYLAISPWRWLGANHLWHHTWLWLSFGIRPSAWCLLAIGLAALILEAANRRRARRFAIPSWLLKTTLLAGALGLPLLQGITILFYEETLSGGQGMQQALADKFPPLINQHLADRELPPLKLEDTAGAAGRLQSVSRQVMERHLLRRDLVITGSCLEQTSQYLPTDLYFYAAADTKAEFPPYGDRGLSLREWPHVLLDVVMGSGSIFPVFPPRRIDDIPAGGERIELVDGGFAHNSPIEAAVLWGATHVVLIEATPRKRSERGNLLRNATSSFRHLHQQAQLLDARSRGKVSVFSLSPEPPHICVLDFADNLVAASIERGYRDAGGNAASTARFFREYGEPVFSHVGSSD